MPQSRKRRRAWLFLAFRSSRHFCTLSSMTSSSTLPGSPTDSRAGGMNCLLVRILKHKKYSRHDSGSSRRKKSQGYQPWWYIQGCQECLGKFQTLGCPLLQSPDNEDYNIFGLGLDWGPIYCNCHWCSGPPFTTIRKFDK